jgi:uncharacterized membrane protein YdbT with pleckstrin-like domain
MFGHYVHQVLLEGEKVRCIARQHWILYAPGALLWVLAAVLYLLPVTGFLETVARIGALIAFVAGALFLAREWFQWWTTEIAVTDRRIIVKTGFVSRKTSEIHMDKVESVEVEQSILGRILDYGNVVVRGTGAGLEPIPMVAAPLQLRNHITGV